LFLNTGCKNGHDNFLQLTPKRQGVCALDFAPPATIGEAFSVATVELVVDCVVAVAVEGDVVCSTSGFLETSVVRVLEALAAIAAGEGRLPVDAVTVAVGVVGVETVAGEFFNVKFLDLRTRGVGVAGLGVKGAFEVAGVAVAVVVTG
jgi:hypothetical protein